MIPLFLPQQVQAMDQRAFDRGVDPAALMNTAAHHLARGVLSLAPYRHGLRVALLCGKGNNGADGIAAARHLDDRGVSATVVLVTDPTDLGTDGARELATWRARFGRVRLAGDRAALDRAVESADIVVDCLLGTGATGAPRGIYAQAIGAMNDAECPVVACDIPTGVDGGSGAVPGEAVRADLTVTLGAWKRGLVLPPGMWHVSHTVLGDLDVIDQQADPVAQMLQACDLPALAPPAEDGGDKRGNGVVTIYAGSPGMSGAAVLCARAALAAGAGLVTVATSATAAAVVATSVPEAMTVTVPDDRDGIVEAITAQLAKADVLVMGPGLGLAPATQEAVRRLVATVEVPIVLDADGLNAFRDHAEELAAHASTMLVMTPHSREFDRLAGQDEDQTDTEARPDRTAHFARKWRATVVAKGPGSVIAGPDGRVWINPTGGPALATGGTGDVLSGVTGTLVASRPDPSSVAAAVYLHGLAGDLAQGDGSARPVTAMGVVDHLGAATTELGI
ncbi:MAG: NAD(P)H-hydrate dehydratase [Euzebya sp.]